MPLAGSRDLHHRKAIRRRIGQRNEPVEEARRRHGQADAWRLRQESGRGRRVPGIAFVPETDVADAFCLRDAGHVGDRDADYPVDGSDVIEFERLDDQVVSVGQLGLRLIHGHGAGRCSARISRRRGSRSGHRQASRWGELLSNSRCVPQRCRCEWHVSATLTPIHASRQPHCAPPANRKRIPAPQSSSRPPSLRPANGNSTPVHGGWPRQHIAGSGRSRRGVSEDDIDAVVDHSGIRHRQQ